MLSESPALHDPELSMNISMRKGSDESSQGSFQILKGHAGGRAKNHDSRPCRRDVSHAIGKSQVEGHEAAFLAPTSLCQLIVGCPMEAFFLNGGDVMAGGSKEVTQTWGPEVLIELGPHPAPSIGMSMYFSRDISAP